MVTVKNCVSGKSIEVEEDHFENVLSKQGWVVAEVKEEVKAKPKAKAKGKVSKGD